MTELPDIALSVRQPWAWAIIHADPLKDIENRSSAAVGKGSMVAGRRIAIHAAKGMTQDEYLQAASFMVTLGVVCPPARELLRGGIIGSVRVTDIVRASESPWFFGPRGLVLKGAGGVRVHSLRRRAGLLSLEAEGRRRARAARPVDAPYFARRFGCPHAFARD